MGMRTPQELLQPGFRQARASSPVGGVRFSPGEAPRISTDFISTLARDVESREAAAARARDAKNKFILTKAKNETTRALYEAKAKAATTRGTDALTKVPKIKDTLAKSVDTILSEYPAELRPELDLIADNTITGYDSFGFAHQYGEGEKLRQQTFSERLNQSMNDAIEFSADEEVFAKSLAQVERDAVEAAKVKWGENPIGIDPETGETYTDLAAAGANQAVSKTLVGTISQMATLGALDKAERTLINYDSRLTPGDREKAVKLISKAREDGELDVARNLMTQAAEFSENPAEQEKFLRYNSPTDKVYGKAMQFNKGRIALEEQQKKLATEQTMSTMFSQITAGKPIDQATLKTLDSTEQSRILSFAERVYNNNNQVPMPGNAGVFNNLVMQGQNAPDGFAKIIPEAYADQLSPRQLRELQQIKLDDSRSRNNRDQRVVDADYGRIYGLAQSIGASIGYVAGFPEMENLKQRAVEIYNEERATNPSRAQMDIDTAVMRKLRIEIDQNKNQFKVHGSQSALGLELSRVLSKDLLSRKG